MRTITVGGRCIEMIMYRKDERAPAVFSLPFQLATPHGFEVNHYPEGEACTLLLKQNFRCNMVHIQSVQTQTEPLSEYDCGIESKYMECLKQRPSPWGSAVANVAKTDGFSRFCVDNRSRVNKSSIRRSWPMPDMEAHMETVAGCRWMVGGGVSRVLLSWAGVVSYLVHF